MPPWLGGDALSKGGQGLLLLSVLFLVLPRSRVGGEERTGRGRGGAGGGAGAGLHPMGAALGRLRIPAAGEADAACPGGCHGSLETAGPPSCSP